MESFKMKIKKSNSINLSKTVLLLLVIIFFCCLIATGLLVYNFTSCTTYLPTPAPKTVLMCENKLPVYVTPTENVKVSSSASSSSTESVQVSSTKATSVKPETDVDLDLRIPRAFKPVSYKLDLIPFLEGNFTFQGEVRILFNVTETSQNITLHADEIKIKEVKVFDLMNSSIPVKNVRKNKAKEFLIIDVGQSLMGGKQYFVVINFEGVLNDLMEGFYRSSYIENNQTRWIAATQFQPTDARLAFPCFDEPALKAKFQINLARLKNMTSVSNMRKINSSPVLDVPNYVWDHYEETVPMPTYLLAFMVSDFHQIKNGSFSIWARRSALSQANYSLQIGPAILEYYEQFFGIKYPLPKLDMAAIPDFPAGAMENWGLITYKEALLLYEEGVSSIFSLQRIAHVVAHELAHQWFGNLVTPSWWSDLWLNEGFATYVEYLGCNAVSPEFKDPDIFLVSELHSSLSLDALNTSHQISIKVNNPLEVNDIFDGISYSKGASIIRMMEQFISPEVFHSALNKYLTSRMYGNAEQDDLWKALTDESHDSGVLDKNITIKQIMDTWTLQTGFPVVTAIRNYDNNSITFDQKRFFKTILNGTENKNNNVLWWVPLTYADKTGITNKTWLKHERQSTIYNLPTQENDWLITNINQTGYYRVNYDEKNWKLIIDQLNKKDGHLVFDSKNRAQILDDLLNLAYSGYISYDIALNATLYLFQEKEYIPWKAALANLNYLYSMFERSAHFDKYKTYILQLIETFYNELGFNKQTDPLRTLSQTELLQLACELGLRDCIIKAVKLFQNWKNSASPDRDNFIPPDLREVVYCTAISDGGQEEWDFAWQRYINTNVANEKETLLSALGCTKQVWLLNRYLEWAITDNSGIRKHNTHSVFASVANNPIGQDLVYRFFKNNWNRIRAYLGPTSQALTSIVRSATGHFNTELEVNDWYTKRDMARKEETDDSLGRPIEYDPDFHGPLKNRSCTDIICLFIFIVFFICWFGIGIFAFTKGDINSISYPKNSLRGKCGYDPELKDKKYLFYYDITKCYSPFFECPTTQICVSSCPTTVYVNQANGDIDKKFCLNSTDCPAWYLPSIPVLNRCVPTLLNVNNSTINTITNGAGMEKLKASVDIIDRLSNLENDAQQIGKDVVNSKWSILVGSIAALFVCLLYIVMLRFIAGILVWISISLAIIGLIAGDIFFVKKYIDTKDNAKSDESTLWLALTIVVSLVLLIILLMLLFLRKRIVLAIKLIKEGSSAVTSVTSSLFFPIAPWIFQGATLAYYIAIFAFLQTIREKCGEDSTEKYCDDKNYVIYLQLTHLFGFFWLMFFIDAMGQMILASVFAQWYWTFKKKNLPFFALTAAIWRTFRYHLGTVAFGSLLVAICRMIRVMLEYIDKKSKKLNNPAIKALMCCFKCCMACLERFIKFINKNAYIMCAIHGKNFCASAKDAFLLIARNIVRVYVLDKITNLLFFLSKIFITICVGSVAYIFLATDMVMDNSNKKPEIVYPLSPVAAIMVITFIIATVFFNVYTMAIDTLFLCFLEDGERNDGSKEKPFYMSKSLRKVLGKKNK